MKDTITRLAAAGLLLSLFACSGSSGTSASSGSPTVVGSTFTLQGVVADAITGARLGGDLKLYLVQGADVRGPSRLNSNTSDPLAGEYAFVGIPVEFNTGNQLWKIVAVKTGYERFESEFTFPANSASGIIDTVYSKIGNIYMWPTGTQSPNYAFTVTFNGKAVPNAVVQLDPVVGSNNKLFGQSPTGSTLPATNGYIASLSAQTDASGKAAFSGSTLALGAAYTPQVLPLTFTDAAGSKVDLGFATGATIVVGLSNTAQSLTMSDLVPTANPIFVVSASNQAAGQVQASGQLQIVFNAPVTLSNPNGFTATSTSPTAVFAAQQVNASLSPDGLTLTLAPNFTTPPAATERNVSVTYGNGTAFVVPKDNPALSFKVLPGAPGGLPAVTFADGTTVNPTVTMVGP